MAGIVMMGVAAVGAVAAAGAAGFWARRRCDEASATPRHVPLPGQRSFLLTARTQGDRGSCPLARQGPAFQQAPPTFRRVGPWRRYEVLATAGVVAWPLLATLGVIAQTVLNVGIPTAALVYFSVRRIRRSRAITLDGIGPLDDRPEKVPRQPCRLEGRPHSGGIQDHSGLGPVRDRLAGGSMGQPSGWEAARADRLVMRAPNGKHPINQRQPDFGPVAVVGLGYVGLPMALAVAATGTDVVGVDIDEARLAAIRSQRSELPAEDVESLAGSLRAGRLVLSSCPSVLAGCKTVVICVPTPIDQHLSPDLRALRRACQDVVDHGVAGQLIVLTSTTYVGSTRELLVGPLRDRGLTPGEDVFVAFSPERLVVGGAAAHARGEAREINVTNNGHGAVQWSDGWDGEASLVRWMRSVPRIVGGVTAACTERATPVLRCSTEVVHPVSSPEVAEFTKLIENTFRAVNIALANEFAEISGVFGVNVMEALTAAETKPYGFMRFNPGPGVGGHCIPCDPHYLLWALRAKRVEAPLIERAMTEIAQRPRRVVQQAVESFAGMSRPLRGSHILILGVAFKPGVSDVRESPALEIMSQLRERGAVVEYHDPLVAAVRLRTGEVARSIDVPGDGSWDLVIIQTIHPGSDITWLDRVPAVLDATYGLPQPQGGMSWQPVEGVTVANLNGGEALCGRS